MEVLFPLLLGLGQGLLHAAGPDHCAAVVLLGSSGKGRRQAFGTALKFALGHVLMLGGLSAFCILAGVGLSAGFERWAEVLGGLVLIGLGLGALLMPGIFLHGHPHVGGHGAAHEHSRLALGAGALLAISGVRSLLFALPPLMVGGSRGLAALGYLPGFALGLFAGMGVLGLVLQAFTGLAGERGSHWFHRAAAVGSAALGVLWITTRM